MESLLKFMNFPCFDELIAMSAMKDVELAFVEQIVSDIVQNVL